MTHAYKQTSTKDKIKAKSEQPQHYRTRKRQSVVRQELASPHATVSKEMREGKVIDNQEGWELEGERNAND